MAQLIWLVCIFLYLKLCWFVFRFWKIFWDSISLSWLIWMFGCYVSDFVGVITHVYAEPFDNLGQEITNAVRIVLIDKRYLKFEMKRFFCCFIYCFDLFIHFFLHGFFFYIWRGTCECVLLGEYVDQFKKMMSESSTELSILVLQFVKIDSKRGLLDVISLSISIM
jgi:hypothetical protein